MRTRQQHQVPIRIRPALTLPEKISIILGSCMPGKNKIDAILCLMQSEIEEKDICLNRQKIKQQVLSEILLLFEKIEKNKAVKKNKNYISKRINLCWRNCRKSGWSIARNEKERNCNYLENLQAKQAVIPKKEGKKEEGKKEKKTRNSGWHTKTWKRYSRFYLGIENETKKRQPQRQLLLPLPPNEKKVE